MGKKGQVGLFIVCLILTAAIFGFIGWRIVNIQKEADAARVEAEAKARAEAEEAAKGK